MQKNNTSLFFMILLSHMNLQTLNIYKKEVEHSFRSLDVNIMQKSNLIIMQSFKSLLVLFKLFQDFKEDVGIK